MVKSLEAYLSQIISHLTQLTRMQDLASQLNPQQTYDDCVQFLTVQNKFLKTETLFFMKQDPLQLLTVYKLYQIFHYTTQL